jgi:hypothetical protein
MKTSINVLHIRYIKYNQYVFGCPAASQYDNSVHRTKLFKISLEIQKNNKGWKSKYNNVFLIELKYFAILSIPLYIPHKKRRGWASPLV